MSYYWCHTHCSHGDQVIWIHEKQWKIKWFCEDIFCPVHFVKILWLLLSREAWFLTPWPHHAQLSSAQTWTVHHKKKTKQTNKQNKTKKPQTKTKTKPFNLRYLLTFWFIMMTQSHVIWSRHVIPKTKTTVLGIAIKCTSLNGKMHQKRLMAPSNHNKVM